MNEHDTDCETELTSHGYTPCRCPERHAQKAVRAFLEDIAEHGASGDPMNYKQEAVALLRLLDGV